MSKFEPLQAQSPPVPKGISGGVPTMKRTVDFGESGQAAFRNMGDFAFDGGPRRIFGEAQSPKALGLSFGEGLQF